MKKSLIPIVSSFFLIILISWGCDPYAVRECPAFSYEYEKWMDLDNRDTLRFKNSEEEILTFTKQEEYISDPYTEGAIGSKDEESVICRMVGSFIYRTSDSELGLEVFFEQFDDARIPEEDNQVYVSYFPSSTQQTNNRYIHSLQIEPALTTIGDQETLPIFEIDNIQYLNVIESSIDTTDVPSESNFDIWKTFIARDFGIIKMITRDGEEWTLLQ